MNSFEKDYYAALGVAKDASQSEVKKAYRNLARDLHPDKGGDEARFKEVSEAYAVLSDPRKRAEYDEQRALFGSGGFRMGGAGGPGGPGGFSMGDVFGGGGGGLGDILGGMFGNGARARGPRRGGDVETEVTLDFAEAVRGVTVPLRLASPHACSACHGSGARAGTTPRTCATCRGAGTVGRNQGPFSLSEPCRDCRGRGRVVDDPCPDCRGSGTATRERTLTIRIPAGVADGQRIRIAGRGSPGENGAPAGDLYVVVHVAPHPVFGRRGDHLTLTLPVTFAEAVLGAEVTVPTLEGTVTLRVPAGTPGGKTFRVKGRGARGGDLLVTVEVVVPTKLSGKARKALETLAAEDGTDPRAHLMREVSGRG